MVTIRLWRRCNALSPCPSLCPRHRLTALVVSGLLSLAFITPLSAQNSVQGVPNALQGFSQNRDKPIKIEAATLVMQEKRREATFTGNVKVIQGDTTMTSKTLDVYYESKDSLKSAKGGPKMHAATAGPGGSSQIKRLVARGNVVVTQKDQRVSGNSAIFETQTNLITMAGDVILTQTSCGNTLKGDRLQVDMTTGVSRVESDNRVIGIFNSECHTKGGISPLQSPAKGGAAPPQSPAKPPAKPK